MTDRIFVCPVEPDLLVDLEQKSCVLRLDDPEDIFKANDLARKHNLTIHCLVMKTDGAVTGVPFHQRLGEVPCALIAQRMGPIRDLLRMLPVLHSLNLRIYLPAHSSENLTSLRIMASLGLATAVDFRGHVADWEALSDLMTYALLGLVAHGPISPFAEIGDLYSPRKYTDFGFVYFDDPRRFLHLDRQGRVALTETDRTDGRFVAESIHALEDIEKIPEYLAYLEQFRAHFMSPKGCSCCPAFRVCLGRHLQDGEVPEGCQEFYTDLMDVVERYQQVSSKKRSVWSL